MVSQKIWVKKDKGKRKKKVEECKNKKRGTGRGTERCMWNHNAMNQGLGKLQMEQLTKITENILQKMSF